MGGRLAASSRSQIASSQLLHRDYVAVGLVAFWQLADPLHVTVWYARILQHFR
jgi:hypothetical protein